MKRLIFPLSFFLINGALAGTPYLSDENHGAQNDFQEEEAQKDLHKPGEISESNAQESMEREEDSRDAGGDYDPIDDDLENSHGRGELKGYPIQ